MKKQPSTIEAVVRQKLCTGCGTCAGICPHDAIEMILDAKKGAYLPHVDTDRCVHCGLCYAACPGYGVDFKGFNDELFGKIKHDVAIGRYLECYIGHATDGNVRYKGASGGLVSSLLRFAIQKDLIDGALVTRMRIDDPLTPESFIARTPEEVLSATGSKYCPVAAGAALREILDSNGRYAVVGLPCHIQGIRKAERCLPQLKERIRYRISIACSLNFSFLGTNRILEGIGIPRGAVKALQYRSRGWPGGMTIHLKDGTERYVPKDEYYRQLGPHSLRRCTLCSDMLGELSDLSCGDAWIPEIMSVDKVGSSFVISRTPEGEELLEYAASAEAVELSELGCRELLAAQGNALFKKRKLAARMRLVQLAGGRVPTYRQELLASVRGDYANMIKFYAARYALCGHHRILGALFQAARRLKRRASRHGNDSGTVAGRKTG